MPTFSQLSLQSALYTTLTGDAALMALVSAVYDRVPDDAQFAYVSLGDMQARDWSCKTFSGMQYGVELHIFSQEGGRKQSIQIMERIYALLHEQSLVVSGQTMVLMRFESSDIMLENDGWTYHGRMRFNVLLQSN